MMNIRTTAMDSLVDSLDSLSSTQLYALIVGLTVVISVVLLGKAPAESAEPVFLSQRRNRPAPAAGSREPRWHIFSYLNYVIVATFAWSVGAFFWNTYNGVTMWHFLALWSVFLSYFFAFFGVGLVYDVTEEEEQP
jgi:hypothetical protein